jgi:heat shock protein HtpX
VVAAVVGTGVLAVTTVVTAVLAGAAFAAVFAFGWGLVVSVLYDAGVVASQRSLFGVEATTAILAVGVVGAVLGGVEAVLEARRTARERHERVIERTRAPTGGESGLVDAVDRLARQVDIARPELRVLDTIAPVTYTVRYGDAPTLVVSRGLLGALDGREGEAVLAHEIAHLKNGDVRATTAAVVPLLAAEGLLEMGRDLLADARAEDDPADAVLLLALGCPIYAVARVQVAAARLAIGAFSRGREFAADDGATAITGDPAALATALRALHDADAPEADLREQTRAVNVLNVVGDERTGLLDLAASHPPVERLQERARAMESGHSA